MKYCLLILYFMIAEARALCVPGLLQPKTDNDVDTSLEHTANDFMNFARSQVPSEFEVIVKMDVLNSRVNADIQKTNSEVVLTVMGGMLSQEEMNGDVLVLLLCHELGHLMGGEPLKSRNGWSSTEGQADFYSSRVCARAWGMEESRVLESAEKLTAIYANVLGQASPRLSSVAPLRVTRVNFGYPSLQCRLDTIVAGWEQRERPACWYFKN